MTFDEMKAKILEIFPGAQFGEDNDGQLVVYTDCKVLADDTVVPFS